MDDAWSRFREDHPLRVMIRSWAASELLSRVSVLSRKLVLSAVTARGLRRWSARRTGCRVRCGPRHFERRYASRTEDVVREIEVPQVTNAGLSFGFTRRR